MKQRMMIAKALSLEPDTLFLDELTACVDVDLRHNTWEWVRHLRENGVTIILTTHYIEEAGEMADRVGVIRKVEPILDEDKKRLMEKLCKKPFVLLLQTPGQEIPVVLADVVAAQSRRASHQRLPPGRVAGDRRRRH